ncbi:MAG: hypothetical protein HYV63_20855 [Candidatus Schekmanbacteria bacterium]|nr:hypothetical protein [Candidatus Schekmanbacteria bacterium]
MSGNEPIEAAAAVEPEADAPAPEAMDAVAAGDEAAEGLVALLGRFEKSVGRLGGRLRHYRSEATKSLESLERAKEDVEKLRAEREALDTQCAELTGSLQAARERVAYLENERHEIRERLGRVAEHLEKLDALWHQGE